MIFTGPECSSNVVSLVGCVPAWVEWAVPSQGLRWDLSGWWSPCGHPLSVFTGEILSHDALLRLLGSHPPAPVTVVKTRLPWNRKSWTGP